MRENEYKDPQKLQKFVREANGMKVLWDDWREYTEKEKKLIEKMLREPNPSPSLIEDLRRSKGYITHVQGGSADMEVSLEEVFRSRRLEVKVSYLSVSFSEHGVLFERPVPDRCEIRLEDFHVGDHKSLTMFLLNYHPYTHSVGEWGGVSPHEKPFAGKSKAIKTFKEVVPC